MIVRRSVSNDATISMTLGFIGGTGVGGVTYWYAVRRARAMVSPCRVFLQQVEDVRPPRGGIVAPVTIHFPPRARDRAPLRSTPGHDSIVSGVEACIVAPMSCSRDFTRWRRGMDDSSYVVKRPPGTNPEFYVGLSLRMSTINEDVLSIELDRTGPRRGVDLIEEFREPPRDITNRQADANSRDRTWLCEPHRHCVFVRH